MPSEIVGLGHYAPERVVSNAEIESRRGLEAGWIEGRTGIRERRFAAEGEALTDIAFAAGDMALRNAGMARGDVALTLLATSTPDHLLPPSAPLLAHRLGLMRSGAIDMAGACSGFVYALALADAYVALHGRPVLVVAANILSRRINPAERASAVLFSDAAGATLLAPTSRRGAGRRGVERAADGAGYDLSKIPAGGSRRPVSETLEAGAMMSGAARSALDRAGLSTADVAHFVPHQANARIIEATRRQLGLTPEKTLSSVAGYGNSSAATIPLTLSLHAGQRRFAAGDKVLMTAAGAGLTGGAVVWGW